MPYKISTGQTVLTDDLDSDFDVLYLSGTFIKGIPTQGQGVNFGYTSGGLDLPAGTTSSVIERFPFAVASTNSTSVGNLSISRSSLTGQSSREHGYSSGGLTPTATTAVDRFPFAVASTNATSVGNLGTETVDAAGQSSTTDGYTSGSYSPTTIAGTINEFAFASSISAASVGNLSTIRGVSSGQTSLTHGYTSGGRISPISFSNVIDRFPFASTTNATSVGTLLNASGLQSGQSSDTHGYVTGGQTVAPGFPGYVSTAYRFPFAVASTNATNVGNLSSTIRSLVGQSSFSHGYAAGGEKASSPTPISSIERFPFAVATTNATVVGNLTIAKRSAAGQQQ